jgi:phosphoglycerate dehydrogenase-like enzyme
MGSQPEPSQGGHRNPRQVLLATDLPFEGETWRQLEAIFASDRLTVVDRADSSGMAAALQTAEIALVGKDIDDSFMAAPRLRWIHVNHAGLTKSARPWVFERGLVVTSAAGRSAPALAEHALRDMLILSSGFLAMQEAQRRHQWRGVEGIERFRALCGQTLGIIGMGSTGRELALRAKAFGMRVLGYRRRVQPPPAGVDRIYAADAGEDLGPILDESDFLVLAVSHSDATHRLIGAAELARMKPTAVLVNLARGGVVDEAALTRALYERRLGGASLDVFDVEPLPADHPLWDAPNTLISPHFTAPLQDRAERSLAIIAENDRRYRAGEEMLNRLTPEDVFTKGA